MEKKDCNGKNGTAGLGRLPSSVFIVAVRHLHETLCSLLRLVLVLLVHG